MATFSRGTARFYYEEQGQGEPVIAIHGLIENTTYWKEIAGPLSGRYRFIAMDMRAHGRTVVDDEPHGYDDETMGQDIIALADHLKLDRFHLLTHSTGGFVGVRLAMRDSSRLASLILTDTGSSTSLFPVGTDPETIRVGNIKFSSQFEKYDWDQIIKGVRIVPGPFFRGIVESPRIDEFLKSAHAMISQGDRATIATFVRSFYTDPDPKVEGLRGIDCPALIIYGEKDDLFIASSKLMASEIPGAELIMYPGVGHMTALECPELLARDVIRFIDQHSVCRTAP
jgi:pimeloyl-ACP methyl ester carboxylesterase